MMKTLFTELINLCMTYGEMFPEHMYSGHHH